MLRSESQENPWLGLQEADELVLGPDRAAVEQHNRSVDGRYRLRVELVPEPFIGCPRPKAIILNANPGFSAEDRDAHCDPAFRAAAFGNLRHEPSAWPFYLLDPRFEETPGGRWWRQRLRALSRVGGVSWETIANGLLVLEALPYHSIKFRQPKTELPSHQYTVALLQAALARKVPVLHVRGQWSELPLGYPHLHRTATHRCAYATPRNAGDGFNAIVAALGR